MSHAALIGGRATLADQFITRTIATDVALVAGAVALTAVAAQISVPLIPVPVTGQTLAVLLVASALGTVRATIAMALYAVLGIVGLPIFSDQASGFHVVAGPTGGYIIGFIFSAALVGWIAERAGDRRFFGATLAFGAGTIVTFVIGMVWLKASLGLSVDQTLASGLYPFIVGGVIKSLLAAAIVPFLWREAGIRRARNAKDKA